MSLRDLIEETKKRLGQGASNFKGNIGAMTDPRTRGDYAKGVTFSLLNRANRGMTPSLQQNYTKQFGSPFKRAAQDTQTLSNLASNTANTVKSGISDIGMGGRNLMTKPGVWSTPQAASQVVGGFAKVLAPIRPDYQAANVIANTRNASDKKDYARTFAANFIGGQTGQAPITTANEKLGNVSVPVVGEVNPAAVAGQMVGFVRNPVNQQLFKATEQIKIPMKLFQSGKANAVASWLVTNGSRGFLEDVALSLRDIPTDASDKDKAAFLIKNGLWGSASEIGVRGTGELAKMPTKFLANTFDEVRKSLERTMGIRAKSRLKPIGTPPIAPPQGKSLGTPPITPESYQPLRDAIGRFAKNDIMTTAGGKKINLSRPAKWVETPTGLKRVYADNNQAYGALAGIEPEYDEEGNFTGFGYDPTKGMLGLGFMGGVKAVKDGKLQPTKGVEATQKVKFPELDNLLNYPKKLQEMGYRTDQIDKISAKEAKRIVDENIPPFSHQTFGGPEPIKIKNDPVKMADGTYGQHEMTKGEVDERVLESILDEPTGVKAWYNKIFNPIKNAPEEVQNIMGNWRKENMVARAKANQVAEMFADIPEKDGLKLIQYIQNPTAKNAKSLGIDPGQYSKQISELRKFYDTTRQEGLNAGLDIKYLDNYLNQIWKETPSQINAKIKAGAGKTPGFTRSREIPSYEEGIKLGLTPKFTHPAQLAAHYRYQLDKAISNSKMTDSLIKSNTLLPGNKAPADWKSIDSPFFPKASVRSGNKTIVMDYKAPPAVARVLNNIFEVSEPGLMSKAAGLSRAVQEFTQSAGIPKTPFNSFTLANLNKEIAAGRVRGPAVASVVSLTDSGTKKYFKANSDVIQEMAGEGIPTYTNTDYTSMYKNLLENKNIWGKASDTFNSWFNEPTFKRFMPALQVEFFKDAKKSALESGMNESAAKKAAAEATKNFYGLTDNFSRSQFTDDTLAAGIMAPRFREAMMGFWANNLKALNPKNLKDPAYAANRKFLVGATITYGLYNMLNYALNGHFMWDNKDGKELSLEIPQGNGRSFFIPLLPTISTVPRRFVEGAGYLAGGDIAGATERMSTFGSIPLQTGSSLLTNRTFYGGPIYDEDDPAYAKIGKLAGYGFEQVAHPWLGEPMAVAQGRKSVAEAIPGLLEVPAYPSTSSNQAHLRGASLAKYKELMAASPASAQAYSDRIKSEKTMKDSGKNIKIKEEEPGFISRLFGAKASGPDLDTASSYFGLGEYNELPTDTAMQRATKEAEKKKIVGKILGDEDVDNEMKSQVLSNMGINYTPEDIDYYQVAKENNDIKLGYVLDELEQSDKPLELLVSLRKEVNGKMILAPGVIDSLVDEGIISKAEGKWLKDFKYGDGVKQSSKTGGKKPKKVKLPKVAIKSTVKPSLRMFDIKPPKIDKPSVALPKIREGAIMAAIGSRPEPIRIKA